MTMTTTSTTTDCDRAQMDQPPSNHSDAVDGCVQAANSDTLEADALAPLVYAIWNRACRFDPQDRSGPPHRFCSRTHARVCFWSLLHLTETRL